MFSDQPVQDEERIFGGRYKDIQVECDPPQKVVLDGEVSDHSRASPRPWQVLILARSKHAQRCSDWPDSGPRIVTRAVAAAACATVLPADWSARLCVHRCTRDCLLPIEALGPGQHVDSL
jgi:hypothetical protein